MSVSSFCRINKIVSCFRYLSFNNNAQKPNNYCFSTVPTTSNVYGDGNNYVVHSSLEEIKLTEITIPEYVFHKFGQYPDRIAVECSMTGKRYTFEELRKRSKDFGKALRKKFKFNKGDVVALILPNVADFPVCLLGALEAGLVVTTVNPTYTPDEVRKQLINSGSKLIITLGQLWPLAQSAVNQLHNYIPTITIKMVQSETLPNGTINFQELIDTSYDVAEVQNIHFNDLAILPYSSGTTGLPKGVEITNRNIVSNMRQLQDPYLNLGETSSDTHQDVVPAILPWFHIYGITAILMDSLCNLKKVVCLPKFSLEIYINMLSNYKPQILYIVPPIVVMMNNNPLIKKEHLQSITTICSGAAPLGSVDEEKLQHKADKQINIVQGYGLTESSCCVTLLSPIKKKALNLVGSVGEPVGSTSIKIVPADNHLGQALGPNECGEILFKGPQLTRGYYNNPQETINAFVDGWFRTGDLGHYDSNKCFYVTDRLKELIKVKGYQVAPAELEEIIRYYPGVLDCAVIAVPNEKYGEVPRAYIVQKKNSNINIKKLEEHVASKVADFKRLKGGISIIENIPKTASGKILRKDLKLLYQKEQN